MDKPPIEKRIRSQEALVRYQAGIIAMDLRNRIVVEQMIKDGQDLDILIRGLDNFRETLTEYQALIKEAGTCER